MAPAPQRLPGADPRLEAGAAAPEAATTSLEDRLRDLESRLYLQQRQYDTLVEELRQTREEATFYTAAQKADSSAGATSNKKPDEGQVVGSELGMSASWKNGFEVSSKNKDFRVHVGGRTQFDAGWFSTDPNLYNPNGTPTAGLGNVYGDGVDFRRARFRMDGVMYETMEWAAEYDFMNSIRVRGQRSSPTQPLAAPGIDNSTFLETTVTAPTDLWWTFKELPFVGNVRIGNQKEGIGFEHLVSSRFLPFMERSFNQDTFYGGAFNGFIPGIQCFDTIGEEEDASWSLGLYKPTNSVFAYNTGDGDYALTGRLTRLIWYEDEGRNLLHLGISGRQASAMGQGGSFYLDPVTNQVGQGRLITFRTRDAIRTGISADWPTPANITLFGNDMQWVNAEVAAVYGRFTLQAEYLVSYLHDARTQWDGPFGTTATYHGGYIQMLCFLTDDHDHYSKERAAFDRISPTENAFLVRDMTGDTIFGRGAWQVGVRYNYLNLNDNALNGGILHNGTFGLNWFLNPNSKLQFNYIATYRDAPLPGTTGDGWNHGWGTRLAHDF
jgi:phosphate-selective porin OprO/OprP